MSAQKFKKKNAIDFILYLNLLLQSVSEADITIIIDKHNELRSDPNTTETAKAMCKLVSGITIFFKL